ncbi:MAG: 5'/3'-nucleotidase SurE [Methanospirillaceae archaeon]|nr:5'/3'-nucleotidase SurE [Methanospirillaceae archaeon]
MEKRILLTNDDGVNSDGLWAAYEALLPFGDVLVCAPATQQSAVGRSISIFEPIRASQVMHNGKIAYAVGGTPTDSVIIGLHALNWNPDIVISGINIGENLSFESIMTSGTVGAALEAANQGFHGIAFSLQVQDQGDKFGHSISSPGMFLPVHKVIGEIMTQILKHGFPEGVDVINVNIPSHVRGGYRITRLAEKLFVTGVEERLDPRGRPYYWINGPLIRDAKEGTDVHAIAQGEISVTPITLDCTAYSGTESLRRSLSGILSL